MSNFSMFMKGNKVKKQNVKYAATASLVDENGKPLEWELRPISTKEDEKIRESCTIEVPVKGKPNMYRPKTDMKAYQAKVVCAAIVYPDLNNAELQNSYGVMTPEDLLREMVDSPAEYTDLAVFVQKLNGFKTLQEDVDDAKN